MLKLIGAIMIIFAGGALGFLKAEGLKRRVEALGKIIVGLNLLETDIGYGKRDLSGALLKIGETQGVEIFSKTATQMGEKGIKTALYDGLLTEEYLRDGDKDALLELAEVLGMTDAQSQLKAIKRALSVLLKQKDMAEAEYNRLGKLYRESGVLGGILGAVILI